MAEEIMRTFLKDNFVRAGKADREGRIEFIDLAKGVCILLVVFLHSDVKSEIPSLRALRLPLYFVLSGLFFKDYGGFVRFLYKKLNRLVVPLVFFVILGFIPMAILSPEKIWEALIMPFHAPYIVNFPVWFLVGLFWVNLFYFTIDKCFHGMTGKAVAVMIFGVAGAVISYNHVYLPLFFGSGFNALPFFFLGVVLRRLPILYHTDRDWLYLLLGLMGMAAAIVYCYYYATPFIEFRSNSHSGNLLKIYVVATLMVVGLLLLCKAVRWLPIVSYFGRYSVIVLGLHGLWVVYLPMIASTWFGHSLSAVELLVLTLALCWVSMPLFRKFFPKFTAQDELIRPHKTCEASET